MSKTGKLLVFILIIFSIGLVLASIYWHGDTLYQGAYAPIVEKSQQRKQADQQDDGGSSNQPTPPGFKERDIDRQKGDRFATY